MRSGVVSISAIPSSSTLRLHEQSRVPSLGRGCVVPHPHAVLWNPSTPATARCDFVSLYAPVDVPLHHRNGSPALDCLSSATCRLCYPGKPPSRFRFPCPGAAAFPMRPQGRHFQLINEATYRFTCVTACRFAVWELTTRRCRNAALMHYRGERTIPRAGLQPARSGSCYCVRTRQSMYNPGCCGCSRRGRSCGSAAAG